MHIVDIDAYWSSEVLPNGFQVIVSLNKELSRHISVAGADFIRKDAIHYQRRKWARAERVEYLTWHQVEIFCYIT